MKNPVIDAPQLSQGEVNGRWAVVARCQVLLLDGPPGGAGDVTPAQQERIVRWAATPGTRSVGLAALREWLAALRTPCATCDGSLPHAECDSTGEIFAAVDLLGVPTQAGLLRLALEDVDDQVISVGAIKNANGPHPALIIHGDAWSLIQMCCHPAIEIDATFKDWVSAPDGEGGAYVELREAQS